MKTSLRSIGRRVLLVLGAVALLATACGAAEGGGLSTEQSSAAIEAAAANQPQLQLTDRVDTTQLLDTADGSIRDLGEVVTGDRPVLLWYWAPH